jgi:hypothetical protein
VFDRDAAQRTHAELQEAQARFLTAAVRAARATVIETA